MTYKTLLLTAALTCMPFTAQTVSAAEAIPGSEIVAVADVAIGLNGLVCDFCSLALNKTFKKNKAVQSTYVDLDTKVMSVVFHEGQTLNDAELTKMVEKAGYNITQITRKNG